MSALSQRYDVQHGGPRPIESLMSEDSQKRKKVQMFVVAGQEDVNRFVESGLTWLGFDVEAKVCPLSTADWVEFPFLRDNSGSWYGAAGAAAFMKKCGRVEAEAVCRSA